jgi:hypothetical protein
VSLDARKERARGKGIPCQLVLCEILGVGTLGAGTNNQVQLKVEITSVAGMCPSLTNRFQVTERGWQSVAAHRFRVKIRVSDLC